jgi:conjugal transfer pilus assembly protein TrbC
MRHLWMICLIASVMRISCFAELNSSHGLNEPKKQENQKEDDEKLETLKDLLRQQKEVFSKHKENLEKEWMEREEKRRLSDEKRKNKQKEIERKIEESRQKFRENFDEKVKRFDERFDKNLNDFYQLHKEWIEELKKEEKKEDTTETPETNEKISPQSNQNRPSSTSCFNCSFEDWNTLFEYQTLVFMSFSVPEQVWLSLSNELEKVEGTFVLRGLPNQSFQALASQILHLKEKGVKATIQLDPKRFLEYDILQVPSIVVAEGKIFDKLSGDVSLHFALQKMAEKGETKMAKALHHLLEKQS